MSALAVYLEREGISTVVIGLTRLHLEKIQPPRALWVPFELGRPLGGYIDSGAFQKKVLRSALALLNHKSGPVIVDFDEDDPGSQDDPDWAAPELTKAATLTEEVSALKPHWSRAQEILGRTLTSHTLTGVSGMPIEQAAEYLQRFDTANPAINPNEDLSDLLRMRFCADDIKTYYVEVALSTAGSPNSAQIGDWFWSETIAANELRRIRSSNLEHENKARAAVCTRMLIPGTRLT